MSAELTVIVTIFTDEACSIVTLAVTINNPLFPSVGIFTGNFFRDGIRHAAISGINECGSGRNIHLHVDGLCKQLTVGVDHRRVEPFSGKDSGFVGSFRRRCAGPPPFIPSVGFSGISSTAHCLWINGTCNQLPLLVADKNGISVAVEREGSLITFNVV